MLDSAIYLDLSRPVKVERQSRLSSLLTSKSIDPELIQTLLSIENVPSTITDYREKERHLESLLSKLRQNGHNQSEEVQKLVLHYLLGSLYVNFEKFWGPTIRVITDILNETKYQAQLVVALLNHLKETNDFIYIDANSSVVIEITKDRPDYILHRNFLFQLLVRFTHHLESNDVMFMDEFFRFVEKEILVSPFIEKFTRDNLLEENQRLLEANQDLPLDELEEKEIKQKRSNGRQCKKKPLPEAILKKRKSRETYITASKVIQSFKDIKKIHRSDELYELNLNLLSCRDSSVQKASFNCLLVFHQDKHLEIYSDVILKIINDKFVKTELTMFSIDSDDSLQVPKEHRAQLLPILLRVLFGKMIGQIGRNSSGRDKADLRKSLIMRFIAGCTLDEILYFFDLVFDPIYKYCKVPYADLVSNLEGEFDFNSYTPLNKLQAMLGTLSAYMELVAHSKEESVPIVLKLINIITYHAVAPLKDESLSKNIGEKNMSALKVLRKGCLNTITDFLQTFQYYKFEQEEINFIFEHIVWDSTQGFVDKNYANSTPLLKLIETFASTRVYHPLLVKRNKKDRNEYLLRHVVELYISTKTTRSMLKSIATILANIIQPGRHLSEGEHDRPDEILAKLPMVVDEDIEIPDYDKNFYNIQSTDLTFSQEILISSTPLIFERLKSNCKEFVDKKSVDNRIESEELLVLSALSGYLKESEQSLLGARLLLSTLAYQKKNDLIVNTLKTVQALMRQVKENSDPTIVSSIAEIISYQPNIEQRQEICNLLVLMAESDKHLLEVSTIVCLMNKTSEEIVGQPDLNSWSEGFQLAFRFLDSLNESHVNNMKVIRDPYILLVNQVGFITNNIDRYDFSTRENCLIFHEKLARSLKLVDMNHNASFVNQLISVTLLDKFIKKGLRETNETIKNTYLGITRTWAIHCHEKNRILSEFHLFCSDSQDLDFWENIRHIQLHNRSKALARLLTNEKVDQVSPKTLSTYFMPIASSFLFSKTYKSVSSLAENSIKLIGLICKRLNWITYQSTLTYYLDLLTKANATYQRTNIKLITEILKNFNFDITACDEAMQFKEENDKLEKRMRKRKGSSAIDDDSNVIATDAPSGKRLNPSTARMVYYSVTKNLLPKLNSCLHEMTRVEFEHDKNMAGYLPEKEEIKRVPMAYAIVQLLNLLPNRYILFRDELPSLFLKLASFLKSKNEKVRKATRSILIKVVSFVGPAYIPDLLRILKQNLDKGFQIHVLNYTIHSILEKLTLQYACLDHSVHELVNSCFQEIFGKLAEDKEIAQILAKTYEAKKTKSYDTLMILSSYISAEKLDYLMNSIREVIKTSNDSKKVNKLSLCIQKVFTGLSKNDQFPLDKLLTFMQTTIEESIPNIRIRQKIDQVEQTIRKPDNSKSRVPLREDRYLITKDLPRDRIKSKINEKGNYHLIVENCLRLLLHTFEKHKVLIKRKETHQRKLDGFIQLLATCLNSSSPKCVMRSLKCIHFIAQAKSDLPSFKTKCGSIVKKIFILLSLYNGVGMVQGDNFEMIGMCFKTLTLLLLRCDHTKLDDTQVRAMMTYIEQDLYDTARQSTAFATLHAMLRKKCDSPELSDIMLKISELLVTSDDDGVRSWSIKVWQIYLLEYKHEKNMLQIHLTKFLRQLDYEYIDGRKSVLTMINIVVTKFPEDILRDYYELMFHLLAQRIVNEESRDLRLRVGQLIGLLIQRLPDQQNYLFNKFVIPWASESSMELKLLGTKLISVFVESCKSSIGKDKIKKILSIISVALDSEGTELKTANNCENDVEKPVEEVRLVTVHDQLNYHALRLFQRLMNNLDLECIDNRHIEDLKKIWHIISLKKLSHWHLPIVITSCELYLLFMKKTDLAKSLKIEDPSTDNYLDWNAKRIVRTLCDKYIELLDRADQSDKLYSYITESMIYLGQLIADSAATLKFDEKYSRSFQDGNILEHLLDMTPLPDDGFSSEHIPYTTKEARKHVDLMWLSIKVVMQARKEAALFRLNRNYRRIFVLKWSAAVLQQLGPQRIAPYVLLFSMTPIRELTDKGKGSSHDESIQNETLALSKDLLKYIKSLTSVETFNKIYSKVQLHYTKRRVDRKKKEAILRVKDQIRGVKRKTDQRKDKVKRRKKSKYLM